MLFVRCRQMKRRGLLKEAFTFTTIFTLLILITITIHNATIMTILFTLPVVER